MTEAEKLFNETQARWLQAWAIILGFRNSFTEVADKVAGHLHAKTESLLRALTEDPQFKGLLVQEPGSKTRPDFDPVIARSTAEALVAQNYGSLDAATLVFFHSVLDSVAFDYCRVTALVAPQDWEQELKNSQVPLLDAKGKSYDQILRVKLDERMAKLERDSLLTKIDRLFARCQPPADWSPMNDYAFDRKRVESFDEQRHAIIHGKALGKPLNLFAVSDASLRYVSQTGMFLMGLVNFRYGLTLDANYMAKFWQQS
jgi:hypothetical protein